MSFFIFL